MAVKLAKVCSKCQTEKSEPVVEMWTEDGEHAGLAHRSCKNGA